MAPSLESFLRLQPSLYLMRVKLCLLSSHRQPCFPDQLVTRLLQAGAVPSVDDLRAVADPDAARVGDAGVDAQVSVRVLHQCPHDLRILRQVRKGVGRHRAAGTGHVHLDLGIADG